MKLITVKVEVREDDQPDVIWELVRLVKPPDYPYVTMLTLIDEFRVGLEMELEKGVKSGNPPHERLDQGGIQYKILE